MLTRKQMNLLLQQAIHSQAYQFWIQVKKEGAAWQELRVASLVVACFKKPIHVWTSGFRDIVDQVSKGPTPGTPGSCPRLSCSGTPSRAARLRSIAHGKPCAS